jgi:V-type H+-transporting ATPase subunit e
MGLILGTVAFGAIEVALFGGIAVTSQRDPKPRRALKQLLAGTTVICCWMLWAIVYMAGMHPLVRPVLQG